MKPGRRALFACLWTACLVALLPGHALAAFHLMEVEQVIGGVDGDPSAQAVQLKMRQAGQQFVSGNAMLWVRDAAGANPVLLSNFPAGPALTSGGCREILLATAAMQGHTSPALDVNGRDFLMNPIPQSYLAAGTLTFEDTVGTVYWRLSWGGAAYTGPDTVVASPTGIAGNDNDGHSNPPYPGALPSTGAYGLQYTPACPTVSTTNVANYALTPGSMVLRANDLAQFTVIGSALPQIPILPAWARLWLAVALGTLALLAARALRSRPGS